MSDKISIAGKIAHVLILIGLLIILCLVSYDMPYLAVKVTVPIVITLYGLMRVTLWLVTDTKSKNRVSVWIDRAIHLAYLISGGICCYLTWGYIHENLM